LDIQSRCSKTRARPSCIVFTGSLSNARTARIALDYRADQRVDFDRALRFDVLQSRGLVLADFFAVPSMRSSNGARKLTPSFSATARASRITSAVSARVAGSGCSQA
jgi:hypothetical protein